MKHHFFLTICLIANLSIYAQQKTSVLVISNQEGKLLVDGTEHAWLKSSEATKLLLEDGDHIIQLKTSNETITKTISCADGKQKVITFELASTSSQLSSNSNSDALTVADIQMDLPGSLSDDPFLRKLYAFDKGDEISFNFDILNKNGTVNIYMYSYPDNGLIYSKESVTAITEEKIILSKRGVYYFSFSTNHIIDRSAHFVVKRKPVSETGKSFKTSVRIKYDTTYQEVLNNQVRVYSLGNLSHTNRTIVRVNLPAQTAYWVYWIGVGQESMDKMREFTDRLSQGAVGLAANPIYALGFGLISSLPMFNSTATVDYIFADNMNSELFLNGSPNYSYYTFKVGKNITTDYTLEKTIAKELNFCLWNNSQLVGHDVTIKVGAFSVTSSYVPE